LNYIDEIAMEIGERCAMPFSSGENKRLLRIYAVLCLAKGSETTNADVHDAWSAWVLEVFPNHRSIVPFCDLKEITQDLDAPYRDAIREVAELDCRRNVVLSGQMDDDKTLIPKGQIGQ